MTKLTQLTTWKALEKHYQQIKEEHIQDLFQKDSERFKDFSLQLDDLLFDFSKNLVTQETMKLLFQLAEDRELTEKIKQLFAGEKLNNTENRAVLHTALRQTQKENILPEVQATKEKMKNFVEKVRQQKWLGVTGKAIRDIVNIGIGGSDLGPRMATHALSAYATHELNYYFISDIDKSELESLFQKIDPERTLVIVSSKTFTTTETLLNASTLKSWLTKKLKTDQLTQHMIAVTANHERAKQFGVASENIFPFWEWVGGRYSVWSAIGLPIALMIGMEHFNDFLKGAFSVDQHFQTKPFSENIPVIMALLGVWQINFFGTHAHAILPYSFQLKYFRDYIQQLDMESNGKSVTRSGESVDYATGPIIIGEQGCDSQHSFFQLLHQGQQMISADFILVAKNQDKTHQDVLIASALSQAKAFMQGTTANNIDAHKILIGNKSSNVIFLAELTPYSLGQLIALYEHKIFVQGIIWDINSFDQWGVELGKQILPKVLEAMHHPDKNVQLDASTLGLLDYYRGHE
ncbi:MAG: glucose-6-phosphate isomerase [Gammaproteobacteria bacterium]|nr:glucose-6-phosphate isomerase [Gammaproteobacteria bacterium]